MKKILSLVLAFMMVLSMTSMAFATTFEDVSADNKALTSATELLNSLKIITGYEDGTFKPEQVVTRAEMATMLIKAKGFATIANDTPSFTDSQTHWAKGYIALASDLGIINGRGNGIFDPDATVTYEEAAIMMLRTLGYTNESINNGKSEAFNAANYRTKALSLNLFKDFTLSAMSAGAVRGNIALMLTRNLSNALVYTDNNGRAAIDKEDVIDEDGKVTEVAKTLLSLVATKDANFRISTKAVDEALVDISSYLYQTVVAYLVEGKVVYVERSNSKVVTNYVTGVDVTKNTVSLYNDSTEYTVDSKNAPVYYNGVEVVAAKGSTAFKDAEAYIKESTSTLVLDKDEDGKYTVIKAIVAEKETRGVQVKTVYKKESSVFNGINLPIKSSKVDLTKVTVVGDATDINDIEVDDVVKAYASINNTKVKLLVVRNSVEGEVKMANNAGTKVYIDTIGEYRDVVNGLTLALKDKGTFFLDEDGSIFAYRLTDAGLSTSYSMIADAKDGTIINGEVMFKNPTITLMDAKGETKKYTVAEGAKYLLDSSKDADKKELYTVTGNTAKLANVIKAGNIAVSVTTNRSGELTLISLQSTKPAADKVSVNSKTFLTASNVVIFNSNGNNQSVNTLEQLVALRSVDKANFNFILNERGEYAVIVITGMDVVEPDYAYAIVKSQQKVVNTDGKIVDELVVLINGEEKTYYTAPDVEITIDEDTSDPFVANGNILLLAIEDELVVGAEYAEVTTLKATTTGSAITSVLSNRFQADVEGKSEWFFVYDAPIYVVNANNKFVRIGSISDLELWGNVEFIIQHDENVVNTIVVKIK